MRLPIIKWGKTEKRQSGGDFSNAVVRLIENQAAGRAADSGASAALESCAGALSRALASAVVDAAPYAAAAINPIVLGQMGRDLCRSGASMHVIAMDAADRLELLPCSSWFFQGSASRSTWSVRSTVYGPSTSETRHTTYDGVVWLSWGSQPGTSYVGESPQQWASATNRMLTEVERSLADELGGPITPLIPYPEDGGDGGDTDTLKELKADITAARGRATFVQTTAGGFGDPGGAPRKDWVASRLGPNPPAAMAEIARDAYAMMIGACGASVSMFNDADGTSQRESVRRWYMLTVLSIARLIEYELSAKLETPVVLNFPTLQYFTDMQMRGGLLRNLKTAEVPIDEAMKLAGLR